MNIINILTGYTLIVVGSLLSLLSFGALIVAVAVFTITIGVLCLPVALVLLGLMLIGHNE